MICIRTRYLGPTNHRGSRIKADDGRGNTYIKSFDCALSAEDNHRVAAGFLCGKMNWPANTIMGCYGEESYYHVFTKEA